jgi:hypothetical protein
MKVKQAFGHSAIPLDHQHRRFTSSVETVAPPSHLIDREGTLVVASVDMTIGSHMLSQIHRMA